MTHQKIRFVIHGVWVILFTGLWLTGCKSQATPEPVSTVSATETAVSSPTPRPTISPTLPPTVPPTNTPTYIPIFETADCRFTFTVDADIQCGYLIVPEDRANPGRTIRLHVAIVSSKSSDPAPDPVVYLNGGPGIHTLIATDYFVTLFDDILAQRDLILFDQRGTGYSEPALDCPETTEAVFAHIESDLDSAEEHANYVAALTACHDRLTAAGINLSAYNSAAGAADLHELRHALGYETWNLLGISYGTRLALTAMRDFGSTGTIRSVILDSVAPPQADFLAEGGINVDHAFNLLFARCTADEACNNAYPNLETRFYALVDKLNDEPTPVVVTDRVSRTTYRVPFDGNDLIDIAFNMMYIPSQISTLPRMLSRLEQNGKGELTNLLTERLQRAETTSVGMRYSVQCSEEVPFNDPAAFEENQAALPAQLADFTEIALENDAANCDAWQVEPADPMENEPVISSIPTLILTGDYDPITPPTFAQETAEYLSHDYYFEFEGQSHSILSSSSCGMELVIPFLNRPDTPPDDSCLEHQFFGFVTQ
ncbi:MAG: alpha/beta fold hydrolase [Anaerolineales bacterium]|nr:alpha/beta fold hydrolase [Anaerolineales bacterium]